jgi:hypothetical protein
LRLNGRDGFGIGLRLGLGLRFVMGR